MAEPLTALTLHAKLLKDCRTLDGGTLTVRYTVQDGRPMYYDVLRRVERRHGSTPSHTPPPSRSLL